MRNSGKQGGRIRESGRKNQKKLEKYFTNVTLVVALG